MKAFFPCDGQGEDGSHHPVVRGVSEREYEHFHKTFTTNGNLTFSFQKMQNIGTNKISYWGLLYNTTLMFRRGCQS